MRIDELLESVENNLDQGQQNAKDKEVDFDLVEDLVFFLNNDDDTYRRNTHVAIEKCLGKIKANERTHPSIFKIAVLKGYKNYLDKYDVPQLPDSLDEQVCEEVCKAMHDRTCKNAEEGKYKD